MVSGRGDDFQGVLVDVHAWPRSVRGELTGANQRNPAMAVTLRVVRQSAVHRGTFDLPRRHLPQGIRRSSKTSPPSLPSPAAARRQHRADAIAREHVPDMHGVDARHSAGEPAIDGNCVHIRGG
jgi:hypothetical protein